MLLCCTLLLGALSGCSEGVKDISVTSFELKSLSPRGLHGLDAVVALGLHNPVMAFRIEDLQGYIKLKGAPVLFLSADDVLVDRKCDKVYEIPVNASLADGASLLTLLEVIADKNIDNYTVGVTLKIALKNGVGPTLAFDDIPLGKLIN